MTGRVMTNTQTTDHAAQAGLIPDLAVSASRPDGQSPGIEPRTVKFYRGVVRRFQAWTDAKVSTGTADTPALWVEAMHHFASKRAYATWRIYRAAVSWHLTAQYGRRFADDFEQGAVALQDRPPMSRKRRLARHIPPHILALIVGKLRADHGHDGAWVADLLLATVATGIRPNEWHQTTRPEPNRLRVVNGKYSAGSALKAARANGKVRELILEPDIMGSTFEAAISATLAWMDGKPWLRVQARANRVFKATLRELIAARAIGTRWANLRIYDARHQFSADAKANLDLFGGEVAAAMGHGSGLTAVEHYGGQRHASAGKTAVRPSSESVAAVRQETLALLRETVTSRAATRSGLSQADAAPVEPEMTDQQPERRDGPDDAPDPGHGPGGV
ncbi:hypothetical protein AD951_07720 [Acetobacter malorum]|uniref:Integrase n=2 Tax=Acetobacter malorum TaxID=178901 RepID=A0A149UMT4_9PROT|nr:hypothetical protein AD951_07720 [Acetobacter malorum]